jgi:DNA polymerase IV
MPSICRACEAVFDNLPECPSCDGGSVIFHPELLDLSIAHMDCDAFFASVEKRDNPSLKNKPVIIGGGKRGVVSTACYIARRKGVRSAMPMYQALKRCPEATVIHPRMEAYREASDAIRDMMFELTPMVQPLSLDEAFLDLSGTQRLHGAAPVILLVRLLNRMDRELGLAGSIGLSHNPFLAKLASDFEKPRGFTVIGREETLPFLADKPVGLIAGVGAKTEQTLHNLGINKIADLRRRDVRQLYTQIGPSAVRLWQLAHGKDDRTVTPPEPAKSITNEVTFETDSSDREVLDGHLWRLAEKVSARAKSAAVAGHVVTLKLKTSDHRGLTRQVRREEATQLTEIIYRTAAHLFDKIAAGSRYRLIGVGLSDLVAVDQASTSGDLFDPDAFRREAAERAMDEVRAKFGASSVLKGRSLK